MTESMNRSDIPAVLEKYAAWSKAGTEENIQTQAGSGCSSCGCEGCSGCSSELPVGED